ncbi:MAG TPA: RNA polymerase sigma factor [Phycisphaerae bacterium]|nr:RNA polymerase sigma factor [Phycisphaerae bacterium]
MDDRTVSDEDLMLRVQRRRDEDAFGLLFARYRVPITSYVYRLVGNRSEAESLAQETFLRVLQKADRYDYPKRFSTWFYTIARNLATDFLKKKRAIVPDDFHSLSESVVGPSNPEAGQEAASREELDQLVRALQQLPVTYREVVVLRALQELSYREIALIVGCQESTARSRMNYGLAYLRKHCRRTGSGKSLFGPDKAPT